VNGDDMLTQQIVSSFIAIGKDPMAILVYERAKAFMGGNSIYNVPLAKLYAKTGDIDKALNTLLDMGLTQYVNNLENTKSVMLEILGTDPQKLQAAQKALIKKINQQPDIIDYVQILTWLYTQKNDWEGALIQIEAIEERSNARGLRLIDFGYMAKREKQYDIAVKAYEEAKTKGRDQPYYVIAASEELNTLLLKLQDNPAFKTEDVQNLVSQYDSFFVLFPQYYAQQTAGDFAMVEAQYANNPEKAILILQTALKQPGITHNLSGKFTLQLGDYYILGGKIWDASLLYSQIDKEFKLDALGEEARFRNAKLSFYIGDFDWAQGQLSVLKASTSELIANDALYLSVLITENTPPDSNFYPLRRFAYADLLMFQNKDKEAEALLDSLTKAYPKHPLDDDILMLQAKLAEKHREYDKALGYLKIIYEQYGKDVLGDDAVFNTAEIYEEYLHDNVQAKHFYEQLIIDYPGSTFVQTARKRLEHLNKATLP
jgi:TolA-binding protein